MIKTQEHAEHGICVVDPVVERLTAANATGFKEEVFSLIDSKHDRLVIDLTGVTPRPNKYGRRELCARAMKLVVLTSSVCFHTYSVCPEIDHRVLLQACLP